MKLTDKDFRIILYSLTVVANWNGRFAEDAAWLATKLRWLNKPYTSISHIKPFSYERKAY